MSTHRVIIYSKDGRKGDDLDELLTMADEVVSLPNIGREGETYLVSLGFVFFGWLKGEKARLTRKSHIIRHYESAQSNLAGHTIFMQVSCEIIYARSNRSCGSEQGQTMIS